MPDAKPPARPAPPETLSVAMWATNLETPAVSVAMWVAFVETQMAQCRANGIRLLMLPEFACSQWLSFSPPELPLTGQVEWLAQASVEALALLRPLATRHQVALLAGTMPHVLHAGRRVGRPRIRNRAWLFLPDGRTFHQDKIRLTPSENNPEGWLLSPGDAVNVIEWEGIRLVIVVCLDVEFTSLWARLGKLDLDLILIPAKTGMLSGYNRVFGCAFARATELQTVVCAVGAIGSPLTPPTIDVVMGGAAAYIPCDAALGLSGIAAILPPQAPAGGQSPILRALDLPLGYCHRMRRGAAEAEVNPASWSASGVRIVDPAKPAQS